LPVINNILLLIYHLRQ